jgi:hypothetical protein
MLRKGISTIVFELCLRRLAHVRAHTRSTRWARWGWGFLSFFFLVLLVKQATMERLNAMLVVSEGAMARDTSGEVEFDDAD